MFLHRLIEKYQVTAGELHKLGVEWKGKGKPGAKQGKKAGGNVVNLKKRVTKAVDEVKKHIDEDKDGEKLQRVKKSLDKIQSLMDELNKLKR